MLEIDNASSINSAYFTLCGDGESGYACSAAVISDECEDTSGDMDDMNRW